MCYANRFAADPSCLRAATINVAGSTMSPSCLFGCADMTDLWDRDPNTLSATGFGLRPHIQLDIGEFRTDIHIVQVTARPDASLVQSQNLNVYVSPTTAFAGVGGKLCQANVSPMSLGAAINVSCPGNVFARFVTVQKDDENNLHLAEITAFIGMAPTII